MKNKRRPLRLGSFELLESRALLAHAGMPYGMAHESFDQRQFTDFQRPPAMETRSFGSISARNIGGDSDDFGGYDHAPRNFGGDFNPPARTFEEPETTPSVYTTSSATFVSVYIPPPTVIVVITLPTPAPQFSEPLTSSVKDPLARQTQSTSYSNPPSSPQSSPAPSRTSSNLAGPLDSLSVLSGLSLKRSATESTSDESDDANTTSDKRDDQTTRDDQDTSQRAASADATQKPQPTTADTDESNLIELDPEELLKRAKRKTTRTQANPPTESKLRDSNTVRENLALRAPERQAEIWLTPAEVDRIVTPVDDGLIELLAADPVEAAKPTAVRSQPFAAAGASIQLEANLGFYQAGETAEEITPATMPAALPAEVATALPGRAAQ